MRPRYRLPCRVKSRDLLSSPRTPFRFRRFLRRSMRRRRVLRKRHLIRPSMNSLPSKASGKTPFHHLRHWIRRPKRRFPAAFHLLFPVSRLAGMSVLRIRALRTVILCREVFHPFRPDQRRGENPALQSRCSLKVAERKPRRRLLFHLFPPVLRCPICRHPMTSP